jgi:hypothetical protein
VTDFRALIAALADNQVRFIVVGGLAATSHGSARLTLDLDVVYDRRRENLERLVSALAPYQPYPRGAPPGLPFLWDVQTLERGLNFTLTTSIGPIDVLGEIAGGGGYDDLMPHAAEMAMFGLPCLTLSLKKLIAVKRAAGRPKDFEVIAELEAIAEEQDSRSEPDS